MPAPLGVQVGPSRVDNPGAGPLEVDEPQLGITLAEVWIKAPTTAEPSPARGPPTQGRTNDPAQVPQMVPDA